MASDDKTLPPASRPVEGEGGASGEDVEAPAEYPSELPREDLVPWREAALDLFAMRLSSTDGKPPWEQWPVPFERSPRGHGEARRVDTNRPSEWIPSRADMIRENCAEWYMRPRWGGNDGRTWLVPWDLVDRVMATVAERLPEPSPLAEHAGRERTRDEWAQSVACWVLGEAVSRANDESELAGLADAELNRRELTVETVAEMYDALAAGDARGWEYLRAVRPPGPAGWAYRVPTEVYFARAEVEECVAKHHPPPPLPELAPESLVLKDGGLQAFLRAELAVAHLKHNRIRPDAWPRLYWRNAQDGGALQEEKRRAEHGESERSQWVRDLLEADPLTAEESVTWTECTVDNTSEEYVQKWRKAGRRVYRDAPAGFRAIADGRYGHEPIERFMLKDGVKAALKRAHHREAAAPEGDTAVPAQQALSGSSAGKQWWQDVAEALSEVGRATDTVIAWLLERGYRTDGEYLVSPKHERFKRKSLENKLSELVRRPA